MPSQQAVTPHRSHSVQALIPILLLALGCAACGMNLRPQPPGKTPSLAGNWQLQQPARETLESSLRSVMEQAHARQEQRFRRQRMRAPDADASSGIEIRPPEPELPAGESGAPARAGDRRNNWQAREQRAQTEALLNAVLPARQLQISQTDQRIEMIPAGSAHRNFDRGVSSTLVSNYASLRIESGWQANVFVVHSRDAEQGINIVERYWRQGESLQVQVQLQLPDAAEQIFTASYAVRP